MAVLVNQLARELHRQWTEEFKSLEPDLASVIREIAPVPDKLPAFRESESWGVLRLWAITVLYDPTWYFDPREHPLSADLREKARGTLVPATLGISQDNKWLHEELTRADFAQLPPLAKMIILLSWSEAPVKDWDNRFGNVDLSIVEFVTTAFGVSSKLEDDAVGRLTRLGNTIERLVGLIMVAAPRT